jgi:hypothetical protein
MNGKRRDPRPRGTGSVFQRARDGEWVARATVVAIDGTLTRKEFVGKSKREVEGKLQHARDSGMLRRASYDRRPLKDFAAAWTRTFKDSDYKASTLDGYRRDVERHIVPSVGFVRLCDLDRKTVAAWARELRASGVGPAAVARARRTLSRLLAIAVAEDLIPTNPAQGLDRGTTPSYRAPEAKTLGISQIQKLFGQLHHYRYGSMVIVAAMTPRGRPSWSGCVGRTSISTHRASPLGEASSLWRTSFMKDCPKPNRRSASLRCRPLRATPSANIGASCVERNGTSMAGSCG